MPAHRPWQAETQVAFNKRLQYIVNHVHKTLGKPWKGLSDYIIGSRQRTRP